MVNLQVNMSTLLFCKSKHFIDGVANMFPKYNFDSHDDLIPLIFTSLVVIVILSRYWKKSRPNDLRLPPGPWKLPLIGNLHQLALAFSLPHHFITNLAKKYGNIMHLRMGQVSTIIISSADLAEQVLKIHEAPAFASRPYNHAIQVISYNLTGIFASPCNDHWKEMRRICTLELLNAKRVQSFASLREEETQSFIQSIRDHISSSSELLEQQRIINLGEMIFSMLNNLCARAVMGKKCKHQQVFQSLVKERMKLSSGLDVPDLFPSLKFLHHLTSTKSTANKVYREMDRILDEIINDHKLKLNESAGEEQDLIDVLLQLQKAGDFPLELTTNALKSVILDVYTPATDTTASAIEWAMSELVRNPRAMEKAQFEIRKVLAGKENIEDADMKKLDYLKLVIQETLRLHPPLPLLPRLASEKRKVGGYDIPMGARVLVNTWSIGRDSKYWGANADCFEPERFRDSSINFRGTHFEFLPFGAGKRMCAGMTFATAAIELPLAQLLYFFNWRLPNGKKPQQLDMTESFGITARKRIGLELVPIPFHSNSDSF